VAVVMMRVVLTIMRLMVVVIVIAVVVGVRHGPMSHRGPAGSMRRASHQGLGLSGDFREAG
jgi:hypothetical protein